MRKESEVLSERRKTLLDAVDSESEQILQERIAELELQVQSLENDLEPLRKAEQVAEGALHVGRELQDKFDVLFRVEKVLIDLKGAEEDFQKKRNILGQAVKAASLDDLFRQYKAVLSRFNTEEKRHKEAMVEASAAIVAAEEAEKSLSAEQAKESERQSMQRQIDGLDRYRNRAHQIAEALAARASVETELSQNEQAREAAQNVLNKVVSAQEKLNESLVYSRGQAVKLDGLKQAAKSAANKLQNRLALEKTHASVAQLSELKGKHTKAQEVAETLLQEEKREYERLQNAAIEGQAAQLATQLVEGKPCPVCGSLHHPRPAVGEEAVPTRNKVMTARQVAENAEKARDAARLVLEKTNRDHAIASEQIRTLMATLGEDATLPVTELEQTLNSCTTVLNEANSAVENLASLESGKICLTKEHLKHAEDLDMLKISIADLQQRYAAAKQAVEERERDVPEQWRAADAIDKAVNEIRLLLERSHQLLEMAQRNHRDALTRKVSAETGLKAAEHAKNESERSTIEESKRWAERATLAGFKTEEAYLNARLDEERIAALDKEITEYDRDLEQAKVRLMDARLQVKGLSYPDMNALKESDAAARAAREKAETQRTRVATYVGELNKAAAKLKKAARQLNEVENKYAIMGRLSLVANGQNQYRLSFQRFVLAALLDDVLIAASQRLQRMSKGRYQLERVVTHGDQRVHGGLDLQVEDAYTGKQRAVSTLSGGESFLAALSLALGLAEVVEAYSGGIRLDTIFIDEGFGSLDPEALDMAINTLVDLQSSGRLVGVISHVPELKERVDVRLEINAERTGSSAQFKLP